MRSARRDRHAPSVWPAHVSRCVGPAAWRAARPAAATPKPAEAAAAGAGGAARRRRRRRARAPTPAKSAPARKARCRSASAATGRAATGRCRRAREARATCWPSSTRATCALQAAGRAGATGRRRSRTRPRPAPIRPATPSSPASNWSAVPRSMRRTPPHARRRRPGPCRARAIWMSPATRPRTRSCARRATA